MPFPADAPHPAPANPRSRGAAGRLVLLLTLAAGCGGDELAGPEPPDCLEKLQPLAGRWASTGNGLSLSLTFSLVRVVVDNLLFPGTHMEDALDVHGQVDHPEDALDTPVAGRIHCLVLATPLRATAPAERASLSAMARLEIITIGLQAITVRLSPIHPWPGEHPVAREMTLALQRQP